MKTKMSPIIMADGCSFCGITNGSNHTTDPDGTKQSAVHVNALLYRCKGCQLVQYCNRTCQKRHWNASHKHSCRAWAAQKELQRLLQHTSLSEAVEYGSKANSNISLQQQAEEKDTISNDSTTATPIAASVKQDISCTSIEPTESENIRSATKEVVVKEVVANNVFAQITPSQKEVTMVHGLEEKVSFVPEPYCQNVLLEHMTHIGCLSITLLFPAPVVATTTSQTTSQTTGEERNRPLPLHDNHDPDMHSHDRDISFLRDHVHVQVLDNPGIPANQKDSSSCLRVWSRSHDRRTDLSQTRTMKQGGSFAVKRTHEWILLASFRIPGTVHLPSDNNDKTNSVKGNDEHDKVVGSKIERVTSFQTGTANRVDGLCFRLGYDNKTGVLSQDESSMTKGTAGVNNWANELQCGACRRRRPLLRPNAISHVWPLPTHHWDEITDYLTCYDGQAAIPFAASSSSAIPGVALEDATTWVLHPDDLLSNSHCILAVEAYGENPALDTIPTATTSSGTSPFSDKSTEFQVGGGGGPNVWKPAVEGIPVCCTHCCSPLGIATQSETDFDMQVDNTEKKDDTTKTDDTHHTNVRPTTSTLRLWKHLVYSPSLKQSFRMASFLAQEMVRYAESQAIYTFVVTTTPSYETNRGSKKIQLRLISWDTSVASPPARVGEESAMSGQDNNNDDDSAMNTLSFVTAVKVLYQIIDGETHLSGDDQEEIQLDFTARRGGAWTTLDLCCPPGVAGNATSTPSSSLQQTSVHIHLACHEWTTLQDSLSASSRYVPPSLLDATIALKLGKEAMTQKDHIGLGILY